MVVGLEERLLSIFINNITIYQFSHESFNFFKKRRKDTSLSLLKHLFFENRWKISLYYTNTTVYTEGGIKLQIWF